MSGLLTLSPTAASVDSCGSGSTSASRWQGGRCPDLTIDCDEESSTSSDCGPGSRPALPLTPSQGRSHGSALHDAGTCRPCAWFWKPPGCQNGRACNYCHECPEDEIKSRKAAKSALRRTPKDSPLAAALLASPRLQAELGPMLPPPGLQEPTACATPQGSLAATPQPAMARSDLPPSPLRSPMVPRSPPANDAAMLALLGQALPLPPPHQPALAKGSALAAAVRHELPPPPQYCPTVPPRVATLPLRPPTPDTPSMLLPPGLPVPPGLEALAAPAPPLSLEPLPCVLTSRPALRVGPDADKDAAYVYPRTLGAKQTGSLEPTTPAAAQGAAKSALRPEPPASPPPPSPAQSASARLTEQALAQVAAGSPTSAAFSKGSLDHAKGECEPCAWFWKPQGCANGMSCNRCHWCPDGEVKARKKAKKLAMRKPPTPAEDGARVESVVSA